jgi:hypothetical protein
VAGLRGETTTIPLGHQPATPYSQDEGCDPPRPTAPRALAAGLRSEARSAHASLLRWRSRQRKRAKVLVPPDSEADLRFVPVKTKGGRLSGERVLSWAGGRSLKLPRQFEPDALRRLLTVLEGVR